MKLKLITFDVTNTLLRIRGSVGEHYSAVANKYYGATQRIFDADKTETEFVKVYKEVGRLMPNFGFNNCISSEAWWFEVVHKVFFNLGLNDLGILKSISNQLYTDYCSSEKYELFPEVEKVLHELSCTNDLKLGIISNFDERLDLILEQLGIRRFFDFVLCSRVIGIAKPDLGIFSSALILADNIKPYEALHIGDNIELDYLPSQKVGFNSLLIRRGKTEEDLPVYDAPIQVISSLENILT